MGEVKKLVQDKPYDIKDEVLPKRDYDTAMQHAVVYMDKLNTFISTSYEMLKHIAKKPNMHKSITLMHEYAKIDMDLAEAISKANVHNKMMQTQKLHFDKVFLPMYKKQVSEMNENFVEVFTKADNIVMLDDGNDFIEPIEKAIAKYERCLDETIEDDGHNEERKNLLYIDLKRIVGVYEKKASDK